MSREHGEVVRQEVRTSPEPPGRRLDEQFFLRFPRAFVAFSRALLAMSPSSRIRRFLLLRVVRVGVEAATRGDYEAAFATFHPNVELDVPDEVAGLGTFPATLRGREERIRGERVWRAEWGDFRYAPEELIDLGDRLLLLGRMIGSGPSSGAALDREWADLLTFRRGQVIREQVFFHRAEALEAVGLRE